MPGVKKDDMGGNDARQMLANLLQESENTNLKSNKHHLNFDLWSENLHNDRRLFDIGLESLVHRATDDNFITK